MTKPESLSSRFRHSSFSVERWAFRRLSLSFLVRQGQSLCGGEIGLLSGFIEKSRQSEMAHRYLV